MSNQFAQKNDIKTRLKLLEQRIKERRKNIDSIKLDSKSKLQKVLTDSRETGIKFYSTTHSRENSKTNFSLNLNKESILFTNPNKFSSPLKDRLIFSTQTRNTIDSKLISSMQTEIEALKTTLKESYLRHKAEINEKNAIIEDLTEKNKNLEDITRNIETSLQKKIVECEENYKREISILKNLLIENGVEIAPNENLNFKYEEKEIVSDYEDLVIFEGTEGIKQENKEKEVRENIIPKNATKSVPEILEPKKFSKKRLFSTIDNSNLKKERSVVYKEKIVKVFYIYCVKEKFVREILESFENSHHFLIIPAFQNTTDYLDKIDYFSRRIQIEQIKNPKNTLILLNEPNNQEEALEWISRTSKIDKLENILSIKCEDDPKSLSSDKEEILGLFEGHSDLHNFEENQIFEINSLLSSLLIEKIKIKSKKVLFFTGDECKEVFAAVICVEMKDFEQYAYSHLLQEIKSNALVIDFSTFFLQKAKTSTKHCKILLDFPFALKDLEGFNQLKIQLNNVNHDCYIINFESDRVNPDSLSVKDIPGSINVRRTETIREVWKKLRRMGIFE